MTEENLDLAKTLASSVSVSVDSSSCCSSSDSSEKDSGGPGTGRPSPCGTGRKADGMFGYCTEAFFFFDRPLSIAGTKQK